MFERPDWKPQPELQQPWRSWYSQVQEHKESASEEELNEKPWLKDRDLDDQAPRDATFVHNSQFYKWMSAESTKNLYLCNQGR